MALRISPTVSRWKSGSIPPPLRNGPDCSTSPAVRRTIQFSSRATTPPTTCTSKFTTARRRAAASVRQVFWSSTSGSTLLPRLKPMVPRASTRTACLGSAARSMRRRTLSGPAITLVAATAPIHISLARSTRQRFMIACCRQIVLRSISTRARSAVRCWIVAMLPLDLTPLN